MIRDFHNSKVPKPPLGIEQDWLKRAISHGLSVEIGCGSGLHPINWAKNHPENYFLAIEQTHERFLKLTRRLKNHPQILNVCPLQADASLWLSHYVRSQEVENYYLLYPNPYYKQPNLRWAKRPAMKHLVDSLKQKGSFFFRTNLKDYFNETLELMTSYWELSLKDSYEITESINPWTHFEKKYLKNGQTCYHATFSKETQ